MASAAPSDGGNEAIGHFAVAQADRRHRQLSAELGLGYFGFGASHTSGCIRVDSVTSRDFVRRSFRASRVCLAFSALSACVCKLAK